MLQESIFKIFHCKRIHKELPTTWVNKCFQVHYFHTCERLCELINPVHLSTGNLETISISLRTVELDGKWIIMKNWDSVANAGAPLELVYASFMWLHYKSWYVCFLWAKLLSFLKQLGNLFLFRTGKQFILMSSLLSTKFSFLESWNIFASW